jgi:hypothetical protein
VKHDSEPIRRIMLDQDLLPFESWMGPTLNLLEGVEAYSIAFPSQGLTREIAHQGREMILCTTEAPALYKNLSNDEHESDCIRSLRLSYQKVLSILYL